MDEILKKLNTAMDIQTALREVSDMMWVPLGAEKCEVLLADQFDRLSELGFPTTIARNVIQKKSGIIIPEVSASDERFCFFIQQLR